jgi:hypothetical protein
MQRSQLEHAQLYSLHRAWFPIAPVSTAVIHQAQKALEHPRKQLLSSVQAVGDKLSTFLRVNRLLLVENQGAPWEWINPAFHLRVNPLYAASAGGVYVAIQNRLADP